jgi:hypothetical protein
MVTTKPKKPLSENATRKKLLKKMQRQRDKQTGRAPK